MILERQLFERDLQLTESIETYRLAPR
jgi:hypothetical protein